MIIVIADDLTIVHGYSEGNLVMNPKGREPTARINKPMDSRSDLYWLDVTLCRLNRGKLPHDATNPGEMKYSHITKRPIPVFRD